MIIFHNPSHHGHSGRQELFRGRLVPCHESPARLDFVLAELQRHPVGDLRTPDAPDMALLARIHSPRYLHFLEHAWAEWLALDPANADTDVLPSVWPVRGFRHDVLPTHFAARVGLFSIDAGTPLTAGTWDAARMGAACAIDAARAVAAAGGPRSAMALTRPPGHLATMQAPTFSAVTASSTTPQSPRKHCVKPVPYGWPCWTSTTTTATARKISSTAAPTC